MVCESRAIKYAWLHIRQNRRVMAIYCLGVSGENDDITAGISYILKLIRIMLIIGREIDMNR